MLRNLERALAEDLVTFAPKVTGRARTPRVRDFSCEEYAANLEVEAERVVAL
jgi:hypothetical protein